MVGRSEEESDVLGQGWTFEEILEHDILRPLKLHRMFFLPPSEIKVREDIVVPVNTTSGPGNEVDSNYRIFNPYGTMERKI